MHPNISCRTFTTYARKDLWLTVAFSAFFFIANAQTWNPKAPDSLLRAARTSTGDKKVDVLNQLAKQTNLFSTSEAVSIIQQALQMAEMLHYQKGKANAIENMAVLMSRRSGYRTAINLINSAAIIHRQNNFFEAYINCLILKASYYDFLTDNEKII
ncbi:MAG TPA: hypothetical protein VF298_04075, partial [Bacteroidales bacterium]